MFWTDERTEELKKLWGEGKSASIVADEIGHGATRNAIIGKVHRLGMMRNGGNRKTYERKPQVTRRAPITPQHQKIREHIEQRSIEDLSRMALAPDLEPLARFHTVADGKCRWVNGHPTYDATCCGRDAQLGLSYCEFHAAKAYMPATAWYRRTRSFDLRARALIRSDAKALSDVEEFVST